MKLSVFPEVTPLPKSKEEKNKEAKYASKPYLPEVVAIRNSDELIEVVTNNAWSPFVFKGPRSRDNFVSTDFLVLDIDEGLRIEEAEKRIEESGFACLCVATTSYTPEAHRYRLIFPLSRTITSLEDFEASITDLMEAFPESDAACKDTARFFFSSTLDDGFFIEGELLEPIRAKKPLEQTFARPNTESRVKVSDDIKETIRSLYGEDRTYIPESVSFFIKEAHTGLKGNWTVSLNSFVFTLALQGIDFHDVYKLVEDLSPESLDKRDIYTINYAYKDGAAERERELNG